MLKPFSRWTAFLLVFSLVAPQSAFALRDAEPSEKNPRVLAGLEQGLRGHPVVPLAVHPSAGAEERFTARGLGRQSLQAEILETPEAIGRAQAGQVMVLWDKAVAGWKPFVIGLPTGSTPMPFLKELVDHLNDMDVEKRSRYLRQLYIVAMDDLVDPATGTNVTPGHLKSARRFFEENFVSKVSGTQIWEEVHLFIPTVGQLTEQVRRIKELGGISWQMMATDADEGHVAEVAAGEKFRDPAIQQDKDKPREFSPLFLQHNPWSAGSLGITLTLDDFVDLMAPEGLVSFAAFGKAKASVVQRLIAAGEYHPALPISFLWLNEMAPRTVLLLDPEAASFVPESLRSGSFTARAKEEEPAPPSVKDFGGVRADLQEGFIQADRIGIHEKNALGALALLKRLERKTPQLTDAERYALDFHLAQLEMSLAHEMSLASSYETNDLEVLDRAIGRLEPWLSLPLPVPVGFKGLLRERPLFLFLVGQLYGLRGWRRQDSQELSLALGYLKDASREMEQFRTAYPRFYEQNHPIQERLIQHYAGLAARISSSHDFFAAGAEEGLGGKVERLGRSAQPLTRRQVEEIWFRVLEEAGESSGKSLEQPDYMGGERSSERLLDLLQWMNASPEDRLRLKARVPDYFDPLFLDPFVQKKLDAHDPVAHAALIPWAMGNFPIFHGGNHRTGWALMNILLIRNGVVRQPLPWNREWESKYYAVMAKLNLPKFVSLIRIYLAGAALKQVSGRLLFDPARQTAAEGYLLKKGASVAALFTLSQPMRRFPVVAVVDQRQRELLRGIAVAAGYSVGQVDAWERDSLVLYGGQLSEDLATARAEGILRERLERVSSSADRRIRKIEEAGKAIEEFGPWLEGILRSFGFDVPKDTLDAGVLSVLYRAAQA